MWVNDSEQFKDIALKVTMIMPALLLQKPCFKSKSKEHAQCLQRRLTTWSNGDFDTLIIEARTIQSKLTTPSTASSSDQLAKTFGKAYVKWKSKFSNETS